MNDKKKIAILAAMFVVMIGVGAFQFVKAGSSEAAPVAEADKKAETEVKAEGEATVAKAEGQGDVTNAEGSGTAKSTEGAKKALDLTKGTDAKAPGEPGQPGTGIAADVDPALVAAAKLNMRDPFDGRRWDKSLLPPPKAPVQQAPQPRSFPRPGRGLTGNFPVIPNSTGVVPQAGGPGLPDAGMPNIDEFPYTVTGTVQGNHPCVLFTDKAGKQKLVPVGGSIDGDSQVISISNGKVTVVHNKKTKTFPVGGVTPSNSKQEGN